MDVGLTGKRALVTGASSGLGLASATRLAAEGAAVAIVSRSEEKLAAAAAGIQGRVVHLAADVSDTDRTEDMIAAVEALLEGPIDILVANAGGPPAGTFETTPFESYVGALELNLLATVAMCHQVIPGMRERGWGRVVAITSLAVRQPMPQLILSNTARAGLTAFLKTTATEVAPDGVTVNSVQPGIHLTERLAEVYDDVDALAATIPVGRLGDPADFGAVVAFLCSEQACFITGAAIPVDGGANKALQ